MEKELDSNRIIRKIESRKKDIREHKVKKIGLFGSFVKGKQKKGSDIDILVEFEESTFSNYFGLWRLLEKLLGRKIDLVIEKNLKPELDYVRREAVYVEI